MTVRGRLAHLKDEQISILRDCFSAGVRPREACLEAKCSQQSAARWYQRFRDDRYREKISGPIHHGLEPRPRVPMPKNPPAFADVQHKLMRGK